MSEVRRCESLPIQLPSRLTRLWFSSPSSASAAASASTPTSGPRASATAAGARACTCTAACSRPVRAGRCTARCTPVTEVPCLGAVPTDALESTAAAVASRGGLAHIAATTPAITHTAVAAPPAVAETAVTPPTAVT